MAVLVLLNGVPASGKSTIAHAWVERHGDALPLALDVDVLRAMLGGWRHVPSEAGTVTRDLALAAARVHLATGRDVIVPQYLRRSGFDDALAALADETGAAFLECAVVSDAALADRRFADREAEAVAAHEVTGGRGPHGPIVHGGLGGDRMVDVVTEFEAFVAGRPGVVRIPGTSGELGAALDQLDAAVDAARRTARTASSGTSPNRSSSSTGTHSGS